MIEFINVMTLSAPLIFASLMYVNSKNPKKPNKREIVTYSVCFILFILELIVINK